MKAPTLKSILARNADAAWARSQTAIGEAFGVSQQVISYWIRNEKPVAAECVLRAEAKTGVSRHVLRPDLYPPAERAA